MPDLPEADGMSLEYALNILTTLHTKDDRVVGFVVERLGARPTFHGFSDADYINAWRTVRKYMHMQTEPVTDA